ncbi:TPA: hypothetical protein NIJ37_004471 [Pseudomonas aeruginosa]|nr:hypothetical protein [Pseudomonas aeruginosa]
MDKQSSTNNDVISVLEVWEAIGHDGGVSPSKGELLESLRNMTAICDAHGNDMPAQSAIDQRKVIADAITGALAFGTLASRPPAEDHWLRPFYDLGASEGQRTRDLAMLVRMLASTLKRHAPDSSLVERAANYLAAKGLVGTPLRSTPEPEKRGDGDERAELPEVVAYADPVAFARFKERGHEGGVAGREWMWAEPTPGLVAMSRTDECERIVGELRAVITQLRQHKNDYMDAGQETYRALQNEIREREAEIARLNGLVSSRTTERDAALAEIAQLEKKLAMALDAASKGDAARHAACGMEMEIRELKAKLADAQAGRREQSAYELLRQALELMPLGTKKRAEWVGRASDLLCIAQVQASPPPAQAQHSDQSELRRIAVALTNPLLNGQEASDLMVRYEALTMPDHIIALIDSQAQYIAPDELRAICMLVAEAGIKYGRGRDRAVASDECREVVDSVLPLEPSPSNSEQHCEPEIMAVAEGVLTFMRSENEGSHCTCCNGPHIFCRYFEGMSDFDDITRKARFRNDLEGRTFRLVLELLPAALSGKEGV